MHAADKHIPKILIVDDEKGLRQGTKRLLEREGYSVTAAENGTEGIKCGTSEEFDIAVIDLKMPDIDGISVLKEIRKKFPDTVFFIATAYASYETAIESAKHGAFSYIPKPFTPEEFLNNISRGYKNRQLIVEKKNWAKEREERLLELAFEKTRINTVINSISDGILVVNRNGQTVLYNPNSLLYLQLNELKIEDNILGTINPGISSIVYKCLNNPTNSKKSYSSQVVIKPNQELVIEATASPVPQPDGSLAGVVVVMKNITELKKIEQIKSQFVSMVSHELKAPMAAVYGFLELLSDASIELSDQQRQIYFLRTQKRIDSLLKMVNDLLDISNMEMNTYQREITELDVKEVINSTVDLLQPEIKNKKITISKNFIEPIPLIQADYGEMTRLFTNLISNAIKYNKENGDIHISGKTSEQYLFIEMSDTGIGMTPEEMKNLFHEFHRAKNEYTKNINGTGLGLAIVKRIVDAYSGKIEINSAFKKGTCVKISLPLQPAIFTN